MSAQTVQANYKNENEKIIEKYGMNMFAKIHGVVGEERMFSDGSVRVSHSCSVLLRTIRCVWKSAISVQLFPRLTLHV